MRAGIVLCSWHGLPLAMLRTVRQERPADAAEPFLAEYAAGTPCPCTEQTLQFAQMLDGQTDFTPDMLGARQRNSLRRLRADGLLEQSTAPMERTAFPLREAHFPSVYVHSAVWELSSALPLSVCEQIASRLRYCGILNVTLLRLRPGFPELTAALTACGIRICGIRTENGTLPDGLAAMLRRHGQNPVILPSLCGGSMPDEPEPAAESAPTLRIFADGSAGSPPGCPFSAEVRD